MFSDEELEAAVLRYLTSDVRTERSAAGTRDVLGAKKQVFELISAAFLLRPSAVFSVCWLASNSLRAKLIEQFEDMQYILDAAPRVSKTSQRVESTTDLYNAEASLVTLTAAFSARSAGVAGGIGPGIARFSSSVERFIRGELIKNTVEGGDVVHTPEELRDGILKRWEAARARHAEIEVAAGRLADALEEYENVRLPDTVVSSLLARIHQRLALVAEQMNATSAPQHSRNALLELTAMRTLLRQAAQFRPPELKKMPVTGDAPTGLLVGSSGVAATVLGSVSGPYNYAAGTELTYSVAGSPRTIALPRTSTAELRSKPMPAYTDPPEGAVCTVQNVAGVTSQAYTSTEWGSGAAAAADLNGRFLGVTVSWEPATHQLVLRAEGIGDQATFRLVVSSTERAAFAAWFLPEGASPIGRAAPVPVQEVAAAFIADPRLKATVESGARPAFTGRRSTVPGETDVLWHRVAEGSALITDGTTRVRAEVDLEALGVQPGMVLVVAGVHRITAVDGAELVLEGQLLLGGPVPYYIGPDYTGIDLGVRVRLSSDGHYRVLQGSYAQLRLDRAIGTTGEQQALVLWQYLRLTVRDTSAAATLEIAPGTGAAALGLAAGTALPGLETFDTGTELGTRGIAPGDQLELGEGPGATVHTIKGVGRTAVTFEPARPRELAPLRYAIRDIRVQEYVTLRAELRAALVTFPASSALDQTVARLSRGARFTGSLVTDLAGYVEALGELLDACDHYVVPRDATVEQALRLMVEHGFDRAADMFVALRLSEFFALDADGVSYRTNAYRAAAEVARLVVPVSKDARDPTMQWRTMAIQPATSGRG